MSARQGESGPITTNTGSGTFTAGAIGAGARGNFSIDCPGAEVGDICTASPAAALTLGLVISSVQCVAVDEVQITLFNPTAAGVDPGAGAVAVSATHPIFSST